MQTTDLGAPMNMFGPASVGFRWATLVILIVHGTLAHAVETTFGLTGGIEVSIEISPASGKTVLLWLPSEHGLPKSTDDIAQQLARQDIEVWRADLFSAHFLPVQASSLDELPAKHVAELIDHATTRTGKTVFLTASGRGAILALRGAHEWQRSHAGNARLGGAVLLYPNLYVETPEPGARAVYLPIADATNLPLFIIQPALSPWRWQLDRLVTRLTRGGSPVFKQLLPGVRDRFYFRPDATKAEQQRHGRLAEDIRTGLTALGHYAGARAPAALADSGQRGQAKKEARLREMDAQPALPLRLPRLAGPTIDLQQLRGQVVLVNFWASWCPPCVHEMPSMQRLQDGFAERPFTILAVNMAETEDEIKGFLKEKVSVRFPILLDKDGAALQRWKVFAFPTSYVIDKQGRIRYALFGAIDWYQAEVVEVMEKLLAE